MSMRQRSVTGITFFEVSPAGSIREIRSCTSNGTSGAVSVRRCRDRTSWSSRRCGSICLSRRCDWTSDGRALPRAVRVAEPPRVGSEISSALAHGPQELNCADSAEHDCRPQKQNLRPYKKAIPGGVVPLEVFNRQHAEQNRKYCEYPPRRRHTNKGLIGRELRGSQRRGSYDCKSQEQQLLRRFGAQLVDADA